jgi:hypothetical protein
MAHVTIKIEFDEVAGEGYVWHTYNEGNVTVLENTVPVENRLDLQEHLGQSDDPQMNLCNDVIDSVTVPGLN